MPADFDKKLLQELQSELRGLAARDQRRSLQEIQGVNLCSNDYLGLAENPALREAVLEAVRQAPRVGGTGSRLLSGHARIWEELEDEFARFAGCAAALYFGSGYTANLGLLTSLAGKDDVVFSDAANHASLIDGIRLSGARKVIYPHVDLDFLESALREHQSEHCRKLIVTESVFSMDGDIVPLQELHSLAERYGAGIILDEAHATAVHGPSGRGIAATSGAMQNIVAVVHTCGKALASAGAFVCGSAILKEHLINHARTFIFTTALPAYMAGQIRAALRIALTMDEERTSLRERAQGLASSLTAQGWNTARTSTQIVPVIIGTNNAALAAATFLQQERFAVRAIRPPTVPEHGARLRFSVTAAVPPRELSRLAECLNIWRHQECRSAATVSA